MPDTNEDEALKKKFQQLQLQQHQKLEKRKLKKQKTQQKPDSQETESHQHVVNGKVALNGDAAETLAFGVSDELDLKVRYLLKKFNYFAIVHYCYY